MKTVVQRVSRAEVRVGDEVVGKIGRGLVLLVGVEKGDGEADADVTARKIADMAVGLVNDGPVTFIVTVRAGRLVESSP